MGLLVTKKECFKSMGRRKSESLRMEFLEVVELSVLAVFNALKEPITINAGSPLWHPGLIAIHQRDWEIIANWFTYYQENTININCKPFNNPISRALKPRAAMYNAMLKLCYALKDREKIPGTPMDYWLALMKEQKQGEYVTLGYPNATKTSHIKYFRQFLRTLKDRKVPPTYPLQYEFFQKCFTCAFDKERKVSNNKEQKDFRDKYWNPFLDSMQKFIDHGERNSNLKSYFQGDDGLVYYHDRQTQRVKFP